MSKARLAEEILSGGSDANQIQVELLRRAVKILADEPARYYWEEEATEYWYQDQEFKNVAPPFDLMWLEWHAPRFINSEEYGVTPWPEHQYLQAGCLVSYRLFVSLPEESRRGWTQNPHWVAMVDVFLEEPPYAPGVGGTYCAWRFWYGVQADGTIEPPFKSFPGPRNMGMIQRALLPPHEEQDLIKHMGEAFISNMNIAMLSIYFMHAKGTELRGQRVPHKVQKKRQERGKPTVTFKVLDVGLGMRKTLDEAKAEGQGLKHALRTHLRRGHFATYREEKPHVSGFVGTMWRSPTVVHGTGGEVEKEYRVRSEAGSKERKRRKRR